MRWTSAQVPAIRGDVHGIDDIARLDDATLVAIAKRVHISGWQRAAPMLGALGLGVLSYPFVEAIGTSNALFVSIFITIVLLIALPKVFHRDLGQSDVAHAALAEYCTPRLALLLAEAVGKRRWRREGSAMSILHDARTYLLECQTPIAINRASIAELCKLPGISKKRARLIADNRPFREAKELQRLHGIGPKTVAHLEGLVEFS